MKGNMSLDPLRDGELLRPVYEVKGNDNVWSDWRKTAILVKHLTWHHLAARYRGSALGFAWSFVNPLLLMGVYTFVFRFIFRATVPNVPFPVFLLTGILAWNFFSTASINAAVSLISNMSLINKTVFPRIALPISGVLAGAINYAIALPLLIIFALVSGVAPTLSLLLLPCALILLILMAVGIGAFFSALMPFFNDLQHLIEVIFTMWFFLTPVVYPVSLVPEPLSLFYELNPMVGIMELVHSVFLGQPISVRSLVFAVGGVSCALGLGLWVFKRMAIHCTEA